VRRLLAPWDRLRYRKPGPRYVVRHHPEDASVRRAALLRLWDLGHRLDFAPDEAVPPQALAVQVGEGKLMLTGNAAAGVLTRVLPGLLWLRPLRFFSPGQWLARLVLRQRN
jgi:hypothetical protein